MIVFINPLMSGFKYFDQNVVNAVIHVHL